MSAIVCNTPDHAAAFRLISVKHQLKLEKLGLKSSGGALRPRLAKEFGLKPRDSYDLYYAKIEEQLAAIRARMAGGN